jgi:TonB family protein
MSVQRLAFCAVLACSLPLAVSSQENELKPLKRVIPAYPDVLKRMGLSGTVRVKVTVAPDGSVKEIEVLGGGAIFAESVSKAVKQWRYPAADKTRVTDVSVEFNCCATVVTSP